MRLQLPIVYVKPGDVFGTNNPFEDDDRFPEGVHTFEGYTLEQLVSTLFGLAGEREEQFDFTESEMCDYLSQFWDN